MKNIGLVLEGGGFRGLYTAGVLDYFIKNELEFPYIIGVSMGACNAVNYISKQFGRNLEVPYTYINDKRYMSYRSLFLKGELFGMKFVFDEIAYIHNPFDFKTFEESIQKFVIVATDCHTGKPHYFQNLYGKDLLEALKASASLPFVSKKINIEGKILLDGGISDPVPVEKALSDGMDKLVVILTQPEGYRKTPMKFKFITKIFYKKYPKLAKALLDRHSLYNISIDRILELEKEGKVFVIRPLDSLPLSRTERDKDKFKKIYNMGYQQAQEVYPQLSKFLKEV